MQTHQNLDSGIIYDCSGSKTHLKPLYSGWRGGGQEPSPLTPNFCPWILGGSPWRHPLSETGTTCKVHMTKAVFPGGWWWWGGGVEPPSPSSQWFAPLLTAPSYELSLSSKCAHFGNSYTRFKTLSRLPPPHTQLIIPYKLKLFLYNYAVWTQTERIALLFEGNVGVPVSSFCSGTLNMRSSDWTLKVRGDSNHVII